MKEIKRYKIRELGKTRKLEKQKAIHTREKQMASKQKSKQNKTL
jgi:hypothetical protein